MFLNVNTHATATQVKDYSITSAPKHPRVLPNASSSNTTTTLAFYSCFVVFVFPFSLGGGVSRHIYSFVPSLSSLTYLRDSAMFLRVAEVDSFSLIDSIPSYINMPPFIYLFYSQWVFRLFSVCSY